MRLIPLTPEGIIPPTMPKRAATRAATEPNLESMVNDFVRRIVAVVETATTKRVQTAIATALGAGLVRRGPGRPPKNPFVSSVFAPTRARPRQLCPVPGCKNPAAPVFGMVCSQHKALPKTQIKKYRDQRRAAKDKQSQKAA
jgi:hypothetical protein